MTDQQPPADVAAVLDAAGVDADALTRRRDTALAATPPVLVSARDVIDHLGQRGAHARYTELQHALDTLVSLDPVSAVVVAAARWTDRYGAAGATERLSDLQDAVDGLGGPTREERGLERLFAAVERPYDNPADC